jgi:hypothetical protein
VFEVEITREGLRHLRLLPGKVRDAAAQAIKGPIAAASSTGRADDSNDVRQGLAGGSSWVEDVLGGGPPWPGPSARFRPPWSWLLPWPACL